MLSKDDIAQIRSDLEYVFSTQVYWTTLFGSEEYFFSSVTDSVSILQLVVKHHTTGNLVGATNQLGIFHDYCLSM